MSARDLTPERRNELMQWASLGHSPTELARMYGVDTTTVWRMRRRMGVSRVRPGRYPPVATEIVNAILDELRKDGSRGRRTELAQRFGLHQSTVSRIASREFPKMPGGRKARHNKKTLRLLAEYFAS